MSKICSRLRSEKTGSFWCSSYPRRLSFISHSYILNYYSFDSTSGETLMRVSEIHFHPSVDAAILVVQFIFAIYFYFIFKILLFFIILFSFLTIHQSCRFVYQVGTLGKLKLMHIRVLDSRLMVILQLLLYSWIFGCLEYGVLGYGSMEDEADVKSQEICERFL
jgi:hypothetical protein